MICVNKKVGFDYFIKEYLEAGIVLEGWEVKSIRAKKVQLVDSYVLIKASQAYLLGSLIEPLANVATHLYPDPTRTLKLLFHKKQIDQLKSHIQQKGNALIASKLYWKKNKVKVAIAIATGKKQYDKRETVKQRDWNRDRDRLIRHAQR